jgi:hypothetical protein
MTETPLAVSRPNAGSVMELVMATVRRRGRRRRWRGVEGGGGIEGGKIGQPDGTKPNFTAIKVSPLIPDTLLVSADIVQPIPKM